MRGIERVFGTTRQTLAHWIVEKSASLPEMAYTLIAAGSDDVLIYEQARRAAIRAARRLFS